MRPMLSARPVYLADSGRIGARAADTRTAMKQRTVTAHPPARRAGKVAGVLFLAIAGFQAALAAGAPWGAAAYGGAHSGVLPESLRTSSSVAAAVYLLFAAVAG